MRLAFIGGSGHHYLRGLLKDQSHEVAAVSDDHDEPAARQWAKNNGVETWFDSPQQLFDEFKPEALSIGGVYGYNGELAAMALERDIPTVCDKPVAATWAQLERLRALTAEKPRILLTEFPFRSRAEFRAAREAVAQGRIGEVILTTAQKSYRFGASRPAWYGNRADYSGTLLWIASHGIDLVQFATGQAFKNVIGVQGNLSRLDYGSFEDHCVALFEMDNGGNAVVHADYLRPQSATTHGDDQLRIAGSQGLIEVKDDRCLLTTNETPVEDITDSVTVRPTHLELLAALRGECDEFYSTAASLQTAEILLRARDAADSRQWKSIP